MFREIKDFAKTLCQITNRVLEEIVCTKTDELPFFLFLAASACYVKYDTQEEQIVDVSILVIEKGGFVVEIDPIGGCIRGIVGGETSKTVKMKKKVAETLLACVRYCWNQRLSTEGLITGNCGDRYIAADLIE